MNMTNISHVMQNIIEETPSSERIVIIQKDSLGSVLGNISVFYQLSCLVVVVVLLLYLTI